MGWVQNTLQTQTFSLLAPSLIFAGVGAKDHISVCVDVSMAESINTAISDAIKHYSQPPSVVVNSAGITRDNFLVKMDEQWFQKVIDVNLKVGTVIT